MKAFLTPVARLAAVCSALLQLTPMALHAAETAPVLKDVYFSIREPNQSQKTRSDTARNTSAAQIFIDGSGLSSASICKLVNGANEEFSVDLVGMNQSVMVAQIRAVSPTRPPIPPGRYRLRIGTPAAIAMSEQVLILTGTKVTGFTPAAIAQSNVVAAIHGHWFSDVTMVKLRDAKGNDWPAKSVNVKDGTCACTWGSVPVGEYTLVLFNSAGVELCKSDTKLRVFANAAE